MKITDEATTYNIEDPEVLRILSENGITATLDYHGDWYKTNLQLEHGEIWNDLVVLGTTLKIYNPETDKIIDDE